MSKPDLSSKNHARPDWTLLFGINLRRLLLVLVTLTILAAGGWLGYQRFLIWQEGHLVEQGRAFLAKQDISSAAISVRQALMLNRNNLEATRIMAELAEIVNSPAAVLWRGRIAELEPNRNENYLAWAVTAVRLGDLSAADQALSKVDQPGRKSVPFFKVAANLALAENRPTIAERYLVAVAQQETNELNQLNLANVRLFSTQPATVKAAVDALERLRANPTFQVPAVRALLEQARRAKDHARSEQFARELAGHAQATFRDQILLLDVLQDASSAAWQSELVRLQKLAGIAPDKVFDLVTWMNAHGLAQQSLTWVGGFPADLQKSFPIPLALAESRLQLKDWAGLKQLLAAAKWQETDFIRMAIYSRALRETGLVPEARLQWRQAVGLVARDPKAAAVLAGMTERWGWQVETEELWWVLADGPTGQRRPLEALHRLYTTNHDTRQLLRVYRRIRELNPADRVAGNNVAMLSLLVNQELPAAHQLAAKNYQAATNNSAFISTYAYSLVVQGRAADAVKLLAVLPDKELRQPSVAAYYGLSLARAGEPGKAREYLDLALKNKDALLIEEQNLIAGALRPAKAP